MENQAENWPRHWVFVATPDRFDLSSQLKPGESDAWDVTRFKKEISQGDIVYFWQSGSDAGLYGWGEIAEEPKAIPPRKSADGTTPEEMRVNLRYREKFESPVFSDELRSQRQDFGALTVLRNPQGTNFRVTTLEAAALAIMLRDRGLPGPEDPGSIEQESYPAGKLFDYRYTGTPARILNAAQKVAFDNKSELNERLLLDLMHSLAHNTDPDRPDSTSFLRDSITISPSIESVDWAGMPRKLALILAPQLPVTATALRVLHRARILAARTTRRERIALRHLIAGWVSAASATPDGKMLNDSLSSYGTSLDTLREQFLTFIEAQVPLRWPDDNLDAWREALTEETSSGETVSMEELLTQLNSDAAAGRDLLNITPEVDALASVLAARDVEPPFAIGLFGDWGSGKTFFMKKLNARIGRIAQTSSAFEKNKPSTDGHNVYCTEIVQIWFNAWHYVESNLWASLVSEIFRALKEHVKGDAEGKAEFEALINQLGLAEQRRKAIQTQLESAEDRRNQVERKRNQLVKRQKEAKKESKGILKENLLENLKADDIRESLVKASKSLEETFDIPGLNQAARKTSASVGELLDLISEFGLAGGKMQKVLRALFVAKLPDKFLRKAILIGIAALALVVIVAFLAKTYSSVGVTITLIFEAIAAIGAVAGWIRQKLSKAMGMVDFLEGIHGRLNHRLDAEERLRQEKIDSLDKELERLNHSIIAVDRELQEADQHIAEIQAELNATPAERLVQFIAERADSEDYRKHLGLLALIRQDFDKLYHLMRKQRYAESRDNSLPTVDRIILYIDDLDRCPPRRVAKVLQAIHLILAFPLFMVVVGVDVRWVGRSLKEYYPFLIHDTDNGEKSAGDPYAATTHDYLEKIFQIPFWLRSLGGTGAGRLISGIIGSTPPGTSHTTHVSDEQPTGDETQDQTDGFTDETEDEEASYTEQTESEDVNLNPHSLRLTAEEVTFMGELGDLVGRSPRAVKRFVNVYRILKASNPDARKADFATQNGAFRAPMLLLAILIGHPRWANQFFKELTEEAHADLQNLVTALPPEVRDDSENGGWSVLMERLSAFQATLPVPIQAEEMRDWLPHVARFSFREWKH